MLILILLLILLLILILLLLFNIYNSQNFLYGKMFLIYFFCEKKKSKKKNFSVLIGLGVTGTGLRKNLVGGLIIFFYYFSLFFF